MQPGFGPGRESPTVASTRASTVISVRTEVMIATRRSRTVSRRRGVFTRFQCPSRGIDGSLGAPPELRYRHAGEIAPPIFGPPYVVDAHSPATRFRPTPLGKKGNQGAMDLHWLSPGDTSWQLTAATLVGLMSVPGLV